MRWDIGIDLGTRNVHMLTEGAPGALAQAAALAVREGAEAPLCFGDAAMALYGRECAGVELSLIHISSRSMPPQYNNTQKSFLFIHSPYGTLLLYDLLSLSLLRDPPWRFDRRLTMLFSHAISWTTRRQRRLRVFTAK